MYMIYVYGIAVLLVVLGAFLAGPAQVPLHKWATTILGQQFRRSVKAPFNISEQHGRRRLEEYCIRLVQHDSTTTRNKRSLLAKVLYSQPQNLGYTLDKHWIMTC